MIFVEIAWPPRHFGKLPGEFDGVLAGAAAGLNRVTGFAGQKPRQNVADRLMVTMKGGRVEPAVRCAAAAILAKLNDIVGHLCLPDFPFALPRCQTIGFML